jgi:hypothetical protein
MRYFNYYEMKEIYLSAVISFSILILSSSLSFAQTAEPVKIFPPKSKPFGLSYEDHAINYWKWQLSLPIDKSPYKDETGARCANGQSTNSSVFYLSGGGGGDHVRTCKVPAGKGLVIPVMVVETSEKEIPGATPEYLRKVATIDQDHVTSLYLKINDKVYINEKYDGGIANSKNASAAEYRTPTRVFDAVFPQNAIFGASAGPSKAAADGFYLITEPLKKGTYDIVFKGSIFCDKPECLDTVFAQDMKYNVTVE